MEFGFLINITLKMNRKLNITQKITKKYTIKL